MRHVIAGNWKMYKDSEQARKYFQELGSRAAPDASRVEVLMFPGFVALGSLACQGVVPSWVALGAQDVSSEPEGAFTGEVSPSMIKSAGGTFALLGHSERRHVVGEGDVVVRAKLLNAVQGGLSPILCIGESLKEREEGRVREVLFRQLDSALAGACITPALRLMIAYEPVWAIGTGINALPAQIDEAHALVRERITELLGPGIAGDVPILYGGSIKPANFAEIIALKSVDGGLVGGASLSPVTFMELVTMAAG
jgi:triosephosphate isomerase